MRHGSPQAVVVASLAAALAWGACGDKKEEPAREPPPAPPAPVTGLAAIPADARAVVGLDVAALAASELVGRGVRAVFARDPGLERRLRELSAACGLALPRDLRQLLLATGAAPDQALMVATGSFDPGRLADCVGQALAPSGGAVEQRATRPRAVWATVTTDGSPAVWFAFGAPDTVVVAAGEPWLTAALGQGPKLAGNPALMAIVERADRTAALWAAGRVDPALGGRLRELTGGAVTQPVQFMFAQLHVAGGVRAELAAVMASGSDAAAAGEFARAQLQPYAMIAQGVGLGPLVSSLRVDVEDDTVFLRLNLTESQVKEVISQIDRATGGE